MTIDEGSLARQLDTIERIQYLRIQYLETLVARLAGGIQDTTYTVDEAVDYLLEGGYIHPDFVPGKYWPTYGRALTVETVSEYCWNHPDWFHGGIITDTGRLHIKLVGRGDEGFVLTEMGVDAVLNTFLPEGSEQ